MPTKPDPDADLMSSAAIWNAEHINAEVVRESHAQVTQLLSDLLEAKRSFDQKALSLFAAYVTVTLAAFGLAANAASTASPLHEMFGPLLGVGVSFGLGAFMFVLALWDANYGALGSAPSTWLRADVALSRDERMVHRVLASVVRRYQERIVASDKSNSTKVLFIRAGIVMGAAAPLWLLAHALLASG